jgi:tetratricopeptide (TPR) repeat protein
LRLVPNEGHFHALLGDIDYRQENYPAAAAHYADAIARNDQYFYYYLRDGFARQRLDQLDTAEMDFRRSLELMPTAEAYYGLGAVAESRGDRVTALELYRQAAQSSGTAGQAAQEAIVRLDMPANPGQYLSLRTALDANSMLLIEIGNPTSYSVADVGVTIAYTDAQGVTRQLDRVLAETIAPDSARRVATGVGPISAVQNYVVTITSARVVDTTAP